MEALLSNKLSYFAWSEFPTGVEARIDVLMIYLGVANPAQPK